jgi:hypothetical protein
LLLFEFGIAVYAFLSFSVSPKYIDLGWCIDSQRIQSEYANKAVVISSPARKEHPNAWIMDEVPVKQTS